MAASHSRALHIAPRPDPQLFSDATGRLIGNVSDSTANDAPNGGPAKRRRVACQRCRQAKLRCEASTEGTRPCRRCAVHSWPCIIDAGPKRGPKRTRRSILQQTSPLNVPVTSSEVADSALGEGSLPPTAWSDRFIRETPVAEAVAGDAPTADPDACMRSNVATETTRTIETVTVAPGQVQHLFNVYFTYYHPLFPILMLPATPDGVYSASPLLFWTVITTAARHDSCDFSLLPALVPPLKRLLWSTIPAVPHTLPSLQAMSILCVWTFAVSSLPLDITFILAGILKSASMHVGLHRPDLLADYSRIRFTLEPAQLREAIRVWCCIYVAVEGVATGNGQQPYFSADRTIEQASAESNPYELPDSLHSVVTIQLFCSKVHSAMYDLDRLEGSAVQSTRSSLFKLLEQDLRELEGRLDTTRSHRTRVQFLSACLQLRAYWLFDDEDSFSRREGIVKAFDTAVHFISELQCGETDSSPVRYITFVTSRTCFTAAILISKVIHSSYAQYVDTERGKQIFNTSISLFRQCCVEDNDIYGRITKVLAQLWSIHMGIAGHSQYPPRLSIKSRLFFSITQDALWQWREEYAGKPNNGAPSLPPPIMTPSSTIISGLSPVSPVRSELLPPHSLEFVDGDPVQNPIPSVPDQDDWTIGLLPHRAMQFDVLFPDTAMGYADPAHAW